MPDSAGTIALGAAALLYMAKTIYELARGSAANRNGNGKPPACSAEVTAILKQQTCILERMDDAAQKNAIDMRELLVRHRGDGHRLSAD